MFKKIAMFIIIILSTLLISCGTVEYKERIVVKTKIVVPTISCAKPTPYEEFKATLMSTDLVHSEAVLYEVISNNVKMMERQIMLWENYKNCVEEILKTYSESAEKKNED